MTKYTRRKNTANKPKIGKKTVKSEYEYVVYKEIKNLLPNRASVDYETEKISYNDPRDYEPDFIIEFSDGKKIYIEAKGFFPYDARRKMLLVKEQYPDLDIRFVFYRDNPAQLGRGSKTRPSDWALKNGFPFAIKSIPKEWFQ